MLPSLDSRGLLPPGLHVATIGEIQAYFGTNAARLSLLGDFRRFIRERLASVAGDLELIVSGSYLSDKPIPSDIDCAIVVPMAKVPAHVALFHLLNDGRPATNGAIWDEYKVDIYPSLVGLPGLHDFVEFFQYVGHKSAELKSLRPNDRRGVVRVDQWPVG